MLDWDVSSLDIKTHYTSPWKKVVHSGKLLTYQQILDKPEKLAEGKHSSLFCPRRR
jgi:hypothetical protein